MSTRTDIHRPSAPEFDPETYVFLGAFDLHPDPMWGGQRALFAGVVSAQVDKGNTFAGAPHGTSQCSHCGAGIRYAALMLHPTTNTLLTIGERCLTNRFDGSKAEFRALMDNAAALRKKHTKLSAYLELCDNHPQVVWASYAVTLDIPGAGWELSTMRDIHVKARRDGALTDKQLGFLARLVDKLDDIVARNAEREAVKAVAADAPTGRVSFVGEVLAVKWQDNAYGGNLKMLVRADTGWTAWGTCPTSLDVEKGDRVAFTAAFDPAPGDAKHAFYSRPTKARQIAKEESE